MEELIKSPLLKLSLKFLILVKYLSIELLIDKIRCDTFLKNKLCLLIII